MMGDNHGKINFIQRGTGFPLVFQHGLAADTTQITKLLHCQSQFRLLSMDCPGHGVSILPDSYVPSFSHYSDDLVDLVTHLGVKKACFGGLSMGAGVAINIAIRYPHLVKSLVLLRPAWLSVGSPLNLVVISVLSRLINHPKGRQLALENKQFRRIESVLPLAAKSLLGIFSSEQQQELPQVIQSMVEDHPFKSMSQLESIKVPCLILANEEDPLHPFDIAKSIHKRMKNSSLIKIVSRYIDPELHRQQVCDHISSFIQNIEVK